MSNNTDILTGIPKDNYKIDVIIDGESINYAALVQAMDDDIRERLHLELAPCTEQHFAEAYCREHRKCYKHNIIAVIKYNRFEL